MITLVIRSHTERIGRAALRRIVLMLALLAVVLATPVLARAASPVGDWLTGEGGAVVRIARCHDGKALCGRIVGIMLDSGARMPVDWQGRPQCGFELIRPSVRRNGELWRGRVVNPRNGNRYHAQFRVDRAGQLALRGYIGLPIFGETRHWMRYDGQVPDSCRIDQTQIAAAGRNGGRARE